METLVAPVEWKATDAGDENILEGWAAIFSNIDLQYDVVQRGAFKKTVAERVPKGEVKLLADHIPTTRDVLGTILEATEDKRGLRIKARLSAAPSAQDVRVKLLEGHLNKMSIGYEPIAWRYETRDGQRIRVLEEVKLWEASVVVFPANPEAVVQRVKAAAQLLQGVDELEDPNEIREVFAKALALLGPVEDKRAIGSHSTATTKAEWDAGAMMSRCPAKRDPLRTLHAWVDEGGDADAKTSYKFPHHQVATSGQVGAANVRGCQAGIAVLNGGRGGADIPSDDRKGVYAHLARHLRDAEVEPPELRSADTTHLEVGDPAGAAGGEPAADDGPTPLALKLARADAVLAGRDPDAVADPVKLAGLTTRLELLEADPELQQLLGQPS